MTRKRAVLLAALLCAPLLAAGAPSDSAVPPHRVTFAFHIAFLMNLHHFLYDAAVRPDRLAATAWEIAPSAAELRTVERAAAFYRAQYAALDLLDDPAMARIRHMLAVDEGQRNAGALGLPAALAGVLQEVAPIYAKCLWPVHDRQNRAWIDRAAALDHAYGAEVQAGIEGALEGHFPLAPIRTDVVFDTGIRQGAYTDDQIVMPSARADYQQAASLEMLYHEASHTGVTTPLDEAIDARVQASGRGDAGDLWHVVQFYTVGEVTRATYARHGEAAYQPYADKRNLYRGRWASYMPVIHPVWDEHMAGKTAMRQAVDQMVARLPAR